MGFNSGVKGLTIPQIIYWDCTVACDRLTPQGGYKYVYQPECSRYCIGFYTKSVTAGVFSFAYDK